MSTAMAAGLTVGAASAAPITYNFTPSGNGVFNLGASEGYTAGALTPTVTAYSGSYSGSTITLNGILVGNNRGTDEQGLGVCLGSTSGRSAPCSDFNIADNPEIDASSHELIQLDITSLLLNGYNKLSVNADSATDGELLLTYGSTTSGGLGTLLASISSADGTVSISQNGNYLNFTSNGSTNSGYDVLLHSLTADKVNNTPEPMSLALLGSGLLGLSLMRRRGGHS